MKKSELRKIIREEILKEKRGSEVSTGDLSPLKKFMVYKIKQSGMNPWGVGKSKDGKYEISAVVFEDPSGFGYKDGRGSKLWIRDIKTKDEVYWDRGHWAGNDKPAKGSPEAKLFDMFIKAVNN